MSVGVRCDLCGIPMSATDSMNVFRMWNGVRLVQIEDVGLQGVPYDDNICVCDDCMEKAWELLMKVKVVEP